MIGVHFLLMTTQLTTFGLWNHVDPIIHSSGRYRESFPTPPWDLLSVLNVYSEQTKEYPRRL